MKRSAFEQILARHAGLDGLQSARRTEAHLLAWRQRSAIVVDIIFNPKAARGNRISV